MAVVDVIGEDGQIEEVTVSTDDVRAQILATREMAKAIKVLTAALRAK